MKKTVALLLSLLLCFSVPASAAGVSARSVERKKTIASYFPLRSEAAVPSFSDRLFSRLSRDLDADENLMISPLSVRMAFAMAANGADGTTKDELLSVLGIGDVDAFNERAKALIASYAENKDVTLSIANALFLNESRTDKRFSEAFRQCAEAYFDAETETVTNENAKERVNAWCSEKTHGKIPSLVSDNRFESYLANAVYFLGNWATPFSASATYDDDFTAQSGAVQKIPFMHRTSYMRYGISGDTAVLALPYRGNTVTMYLMLPDPGCRVTDPEAVLRDTVFSGGRVALSLPKFESTYSTSLNDCLRDLGITTAFGSDADFSPMFDHGTMQITGTVHKTYIRVDEKGTEAAAVTGIGMATTALNPEDPIPFCFDRPFSYVIRDDAADEILFMGTVNTIK